MYYNIFSTQDTWILTGSNAIDGEVFTDINNGQDQILELKKHFFNQSFDHQSRILLNFSGTEFTNFSQSLAKGDVTGSVKYYLKLYEAEGSEELTQEYRLSALALSQSWDEGVGKFDASPKVTNGCSWTNRNNKPGASANTWVVKGGTTITASSALQRFSYESPDVEMDVTNMVNMWISKSTATGPKNISNYGLLLRFSGSQETDTETFGHLKFFSRNTHTIYAPRLQARWDDNKFNTGSALNELDVTGGVDNYIYSIGMRESYKENEKIRFRFGARKRYIQKSFTTSVQRASGSYIPKGSGSYSIVDKATGETVVPFDDDYTKLSVDSTSNYFTQWLKGFEPSRAYKILIKVKNNDGQEQIFDDDFEFIIRR